MQQVLPPFPDQHEASPGCAWSQLEDCLICSRQCVQAQHLEQLLQAHLMLSTLAKGAVEARQHALLSHSFAARLLEDSLRPSAHAAEQASAAEGDCRPGST